MKDGENLSAALGTDSDLPHRIREGCNFSFAEPKVVPRRIFARTPPFEWAELFWRINLLLITQDAVFCDVGGNFLRFRQRADPLVVTELFRGWVFSFHLKNQLRVEQELALF